MVVIFEGVGFNKFIACRLSKLLVGTGSNSHAGILFVMVCQQSLYKQWQVLCPFMMWPRPASMRCRRVGHLRISGAEGTRRKQQGRCTAWRSLIGRPDDMPLRRQGFRLGRELLAIVVGDDVERSEAATLRL